MALTAPTTKQISAVAGFAYTSRAAQVLKDFFDALVTAIGSVPNWGAGVADITALKAVAAADRVDKQSRVCEDNGQGGESIYVFDSGSAADGDDINVVVPAAGTGRWLLAYQGSAATLPVVNKTGGSLAKGTAVYVTGWDATTSRVKIAAADCTDAAKQAIGVLSATTANNAVGNCTSGAKLATSGLDTSGGGVTVGDPVYYTAGGALSLSAPAAPAPQQVVGRVRTKAASGTLQIGLEPVQPSTPAIGALASLTTTDKTSIVAAVNEVDAHADTAQTTADAALPKAGGTMSGAIAMGTSKITGMGDPTAAQDAATKAYVDPQAALCPTADAVASAVGAVSTAFASKYTVPANKLKVGSLLRWRAAGKVTAGAAVACQLTAKLGGSALGLQTASLLVATNDYWLIEGSVTISDVGAAGHFNSALYTAIGHPGAGTLTQAPSSISQTAIDTTATNDLTILVDWAAGAGQSIRCDVFEAQIIGG